MARFYVDLVLEKDSIVELPVKVVQHLRALRLKSSDNIELFNGDGYSYPAQLVKLEQKSVQALIMDKVKSDIGQNLDIRLGIGIIANDKMDMVIQKATELGVTQITPIITNRTQHNSSLYTEKKSDRWKSIIISGCEQCGLNIIPKLNNIMTINNFIEVCSNDKKSMNIILSPHKTLSDEIEFNNFVLKPIGNLDMKKHTHEYITLIVGPEGGFTNNEIDLVINNHFIPLTLGNLTMRAETAAIAGIVAMQTKFGNWINI